jgi:3-oxoacyl-[acyl-carrier protein] reductase
MDLGLKGATALVAGGSRGIGLAVARLLAQEGCSLVVAGRDRDVLERAAADVARETGVSAWAVAGDVARAGEADRIVEEAILHLGHIDVLVGSTGSTAGGRFESIPDDEWLAGFESKFMGYVRLCRSVVPHMAERGRGSIVLVVGNAGLKPSPSEVAPAATNAADIAFATAIADQYAGSGIRINTVNPGPVSTGRWEGSLEGFAAARHLTLESASEILVGSLPAGRPCTPEEVAPAIAFLASPLAGYITGTHLPIDGGQRKALMEA